MNYDFSPFKKRSSEIAIRLGKELSAIHTGRANIAILDGVSVESYGARLAIPHIATVAIEDARTLRIVPWEKANSKEIEKAVNDSNLGVSVSVDDGGLRIFFPELTTERRISFTKIVRDKVESAHVEVKNEREKKKNDITALERDAKMSEDEKIHSLEELQNLVNEINNTLDSIGEKKEREILGK